MDIGTSCLTIGGSGIRALQFWKSKNCFVVLMTTQLMDLELCTATGRSECNAPWSLYMVDVGLTKGS
jgi:hypothetical protein